MALKVFAAGLALPLIHGMVLAQAPPADAGRLLEQQRRLEQPQEAPVRPAPLRDAAANAVPGAAADVRKITVREFTLSGNTLLSDAALQAVLRPWLMQASSIDGLRQAAAALERAYRDAGWLARVSLPGQDVTEGRIALVIDEARTGRVQIAPPATPASGVAARPLSAPLVARVRATLDSHLVAGQPLNPRALERAVMIADELPGASVTGSLQAGATPGTTDVLLQVAPTPLARGSVSVDNAGGRATGEARASASLTLDSPFGRGDQFSGWVSKTRGLDYLRASASVPVGTGGLRVGLNGSALRYRVLDEANTTTGAPPQGRTQTFGAEAQVPLVRSVSAQWTANLGVEQRHETNEDDNVTPDVMEATARNRVRALHVGVSGRVFDDLGLGGQTQASAQLVTGTLSLDGSPEALVRADAATVLTQGDYHLLRWSVSRIQALTSTLTLAASVNGQVANRNLASGEKLYLGGSGAVNAYPGGEAGGSSGHIVNLELRQQLGAQWQVSGFYDRGQVRQYRQNERADGTGENTPVNDVTLQGVGASVAWRGASGVNAKLTWAHRRGNNPLATPVGTDTDGSLRRNRVWVSVGASF